MNPFENCENFLFLSKTITLPALCSRVKHIKLPKNTFDVWRQSKIKLSPVPESVQDGFYLPKQILRVNKREIPVKLRNNLEIHITLKKGLKLAKIQPSQIVSVNANQNVGRILKMGQEDLINYYRLDFSEQPYAPYFEINQDKSETQEVAYGAFYEEIEFKTDEKYALLGPLETLNLCKTVRLG